MVNRPVNQTYFMGDSGEPCWVSEVMGSVHGSTLLGVWIVKIKSSWSTFIRDPWWDLMQKELGQQHLLAWEYEVVTTHREVLLEETQRLGREGLQGY